MSFLSPEYANKVDNNLAGTSFDSRVALVNDLTECLQAFAPTMTFPSFEVLLNNYPELDSQGGPAHPSIDNLENQCAVRMFECLIKSKVDVSTYNGSKTPDGYAKGAKALGNWIRSNFGNPIYLTSETFKNSKYQSQSGILLNFNPNDPNQSGHIDLWHSDMKNNPLGTKNQYYGWSNYNVWFWPIK